MKKIFKAFLSTVICILLVGCGNSIENTTKATNETQAISTTNNENKTTQKESISKEQIIKNINQVQFKDSNYSELYLFGENILFIKNIYSEPDKNSESEGADISNEFDLYDYKNNKIIKSLDMGGKSYLQYQIVGNKLIIIDRKALIINCYDKNLDLIFTKEIDGKLSDSTLDFFQGKTDDSLYTYSDNTIFYFQMSKDSTKSTYEEMVVKGYDCKILNTSTDGKTLFYQMIEKKTLKNVTMEFDYKNHIFGKSDIQNASEILNSDDKNVLFKLNGNISSWGIKNQNEFNYFIMPEYEKAYLLQNDTVLFNKTIYNDKNNRSVKAFVNYNMDGSLISSINVETKDEEMFSENEVYLSEYNIGLGLIYDHLGNSRLYVLDFNNKQNNNNVKNINVYKSIDEYRKAIEAVTLKNKNDVEGGYNALKNPDEYDWKNLKSLHEKAIDLGKKYQMNFYIGPEVPKSITSYSVKQNIDYNSIEQALNKIDDIFSKYPDKFFEQLKYNNITDISVFFGKDLKGKEENTVESAAGFVSSGTYSTTIVLNIDYAYSWNGIINHELSHMIDKRLQFFKDCDNKALFSEEKWDSYNPKDFSYLESYKDYVDNLKYLNNTDYFIDDYSTTYATEDRARIIETVMSSDAQDKEFFKEGTPLRAKLDYYSKCIRNGFDTKGWPDKLAWEK